MSVNKSVSVQVLLLIVLTTSNFYPPLQFAYNYGQTIIASSFHNKRDDALQCVWGTEVGLCDGVSGVRSVVIFPRNIVTERPCTKDVHCRGLDVIVGQSVVVRRSK